MLLVLFLIRQKITKPCKFYLQGFVFTSMISGGERGIRTPGTVIPYVSLANWWFKPLTHLSGLVILKRMQI